MPVATKVKSKTLPVAQNFNIALKGELMPDRIFLTVGGSGDTIWGNHAGIDSAYEHEDSVEYVRADIADASGTISSKDARRRTRRS